MDIQACKSAKQVRCSSLPFRNQYKQSISADFMHDKEIEQYIQKEQQRQQDVLNMIPSENYCSRDVLKACGSDLNNKYSEGYPFKRYYQGQENADHIEALAIDRAKKLFGAEHVNVQSYSGSPANMAIYHALLKPQDKIMGLRLDLGGHLTHGHPVNFSARYYTSVQYPVDEKTELIDMNVVHALAKKEKPKILISGATAYPRLFDFKHFHEIAEEIGAYSMADISHIAGLVIGGAHPSPFPFTDVVMTTTHKTLRGPRGAMIMCKKIDRLAKTDGLDEKQAAKAKDMAAKIDSAVFPGIQGGPHEHIIAGKAVAFKEALQPEYKVYAKQIVKNAKVLADELTGKGKEVQDALDDAGIFNNKNTIPYEPSSPFKPSGIRIGTPAVTTRGMKGQEMKDIAKSIVKVINNHKKEDTLMKVKEDMVELSKQFPIYPELID